MPEPQGARIPAPRVHPPHAPKAMSNQQMIPDGLLDPAWAASHGTAAHKGPGHKKSPVAEDGARAVSICSYRRTRRGMENTPSLTNTRQGSRINPVSSENRS